MKQVNNGKELIVNKVYYFHWSSDSCKDLYIGRAEGGSNRVVKHIHLGLKSLHNIGSFMSTSMYREASPQEIAHFEACEAAGRWVEPTANINPEYLLFN